VTSPSDASITQRVQGVNWLVGLSGGAIGGALLKFDWLLKLQPAATALFFAAASLFFSSILCGAYYAFQMFAVGRRRDELDEAKSVWPPDQIRVDSATIEFTRANAKARKYHVATMFTFGLASIATLAALFFALFRPTPGALEKPTPNKYSLTTAQVYRAGRASHSHTFLLNQQTGELWEMTCRKDRTVEFRRVPKTSYDGSAEEPPMKRGTKTAPTAQL
jgi:hypothetical protein